MKNKIGERIKSLRKKANITQEKLAGHLGITFKAISRWESGQSYPDIEILLAIANYFNITTDQLLGVDQNCKQKKIEDIRSQVHENFKHGQISENIAILRTAVNEFPNDYGLLSDLAFYLQTNGENGEAISIYQRIWADCPDNKTRYNSIQFLAYAYDAQGEKEKALAMAEELPYITRNQLLCGLLEGDEKAKHLQQEILHDCETITRNISALARTKHRDGGEAAAQKQIALINKAISLYETIFEAGDYGFYHTRLQEYHLDIAHQHMHLHHHTEALSCIETAAAHAIQYDSLPKTFPHTSLILQDYVHTSEGIVKNHKSNSSHEMLYSPYQLASKTYNPIRRTKRFQAVTARLAVYAKEE
ncbi:MAG: helix-turn-helix domain-containing protein [Defluviitaleaceae bacterium]|nr:helix-turn-helix domain-containing protein [Defluviitaleaceae bacterium]